MQLIPGGYSDPNIENDPNQNPGLLWKKTPIRLTITEYRLIHKLLHAGGKTVTDADLSEAMQTAASTGALATHMSSIRSKFKAKDGGFSSLHREPGHGYFWKG